MSNGSRLEQSSITNILDFKQVVTVMNGVISDHTAHI
jgi:hypothetical protein